jgi:hypothetical protein
MYSFTASQLYCLTNTLCLPEFYHTHTRYFVRALEGIALVCAHYSRLCNMYNLAKRFNWPQSAISKIVNEFTVLMDVQWAHILDFDPVLFSPDNLNMYAAAISDCRAPMQSIWGFLLHHLADLLALSGTADCVQRVQEDPRAQIPGCYAAEQTHQPSVWASQRVPC